MAAIYEFHVAGRVGSVIRSALPEMETFEQRAGRTLHGTAAERQEIDRLLELIQTFNLIVQRLQIHVVPDPPRGCPLGGSGVGHHVPVVDDLGAERDILE